MNVQLEQGATVAAFTRTAMRRWPERTALVGAGVRWSYAELSAQANRIARALKGVGLKRGDAVGLLAGNSPHVIALTHAAQTLGLRYTPLHPLGSEEDHNFVIEDAELGALVVEPSRYGQRGAALAGRHPSLALLTLGAARFGRDLLALAATQDATELSIEAQAEDVCNLNYTGGTTGRPKGVIYRHRTVIGMLTQELAFWDWPTDLRFLVTTPLSHAAGAILAPTLALGGEFHFHQQFDPGAFFATVERERITAAFLVPTMLYALLDDPRIEQHDLSSLQMLLYGAAPTAPTRLLEAIKRFGPVLCQLYGQSEAPQTIAYLSKADHDPAQPERLASCGLPIAANQVSVLRLDGTECKAGEAGELCVRGPIVMDGYWRRPEETEAAFADGWLHTGDIARQDEHSYLYIVDRAKDMIISGGFNVFPREIEDALARHPAVAASAVVGMPHDHWGEAVTACVSLKPGAEVSAGALIAHVRDAKGSVHAPKRLEFVDAVPHTLLGKPDRKAVRLLLAERLTTDKAAELALLTPAGSQLSENFDNLENRTMNVSEAVTKRTSVRAYRGDPVPAETVREILELAHRAPSGGNLQPWRVTAITGEPLEALKAEVRTFVMQGGDDTEYEVYPSSLWEPFRTRRFENGEDLYAAIGVNRENRAGRLAQLARNLEFFGAPVGLFFSLDRRLGSPQWSDVGMYMQTVMLLAVERGLGTCAQEFWTRASGVVRRAIDLPEEHLLFSGMALGWPDDEHAINQWRTKRDPFESYAKLQGF